MDDNRLREAAREKIDGLPAETAAGNVDPASDGLDVTFPDAGSTDDGETTDG